MTLDRYIKIRRRIEIWGWLVFFCIIFISETMVSIMDADRYGAGTNVWEIASWEGTSIIAVLLLIPLIIYMDNRVPWRWSNLKVAIPSHILFSLIFSIFHVGTMVGMRKLIYWFNHSYYDFGLIVEQFFYEYLKDAQAYAIILAIIYLYRHIILRLQGEASLLDVSDINKQIEPPSDRILVKKLGREFLIKIEDIEHIEAAGNYVNLHIDKRIYPLRETLTNIQNRLDDVTFKRIHRSHIVNLNLVSEVTPLESGDAQVLLSNGKLIPMSRTYRHQFINNRW